MKENLLLLKELLQLYIKIYNHIKIVSKNVDFYVLDDIVDEYDNIKHTTIKTKPMDVKSNCYIEYNADCNAEDPRFKIGDHVRISKYNNSFAKKCAPNWPEEFLWLKKLKILYHGLISDLNGKEIVGTFYEKQLQKTNQEEFRIEKVMKKKGDKLYAKWKGYDNSFNSWIDKKDIL